jgi:hypothetical protein
MNEQLQNEIAAWLQQLRSGADFVIEQAPLVVQEKVLYGRIEAAGLVVGGIVTLCAGIWLLRRAERWFSRDDNPFGYVGGITGTAGGAVWVLFSVIEGSKPWFAPRLYVAEWLAGLLR